MALQTNRQQSLVNSGKKIKIDVIINTVFFVFISFFVSLMFFILSPIIILI